MSISLNIGKDDVRIQELLTSYRTIHCPSLESDEFEQKSELTSIKYQMDFLFSCLQNHRNPVQKATKKVAIIREQKAMNEIEMQNQAKLEIAKDKVNERQSENLCRLTAYNILYKETTGTNYQPRLQKWVDKKVVDKKQPINKVSEKDLVKLKQTQDSLNELDKKLDDAIVTATSA